VEGAVAGSPVGDGSGESTDGAVPRRRDSSAPASGAGEREQTGQARLTAAAKRDRIAQDRDDAASARDRAADARDLALAEHDAVYAEQRVMAADDRRAAARDRDLAAEERRRALADREALVRQLELAETDPLTGVRMRAAGLLELDRELARCRRRRGRLVVVYVDVVGLKTVNDSEGHAAGDELLMRVVAIIKEHLRPYDLVIRLGGDEFLCAISDITVADAHQRFGSVSRALGAATGVGAIRTGFAELARDESVTALIARADSEMIGTTTSRRPIERGAEQRERAGM
jgi:diguanylate cyclase (GGDEF)-like protein